MRTALSSELTGHRQDTALPGAMRHRRGAAQRYVRVGRGKIDDGAAAARDHVRPDRLAGQENYIEFSAQRTTPLSLEVHGFNRCECAPRRGVHQNIDAAESL